jgi:hypothetical protein
MMFIQVSSSVYLCGAVLLLKGKPPQWAALFLGLHAPAIFWVVPRLSALLLFSEGFPSGHAAFLHSLNFASKNRQSKNRLSKKSRRLKFDIFS